MKSRKGEKKIKKNTPRMKSSHIFTYFYTELTCQNWHIHLHIKPHRFITQHTQEI